MAAWDPWFPANFIAETAATELAVFGGQVGVPEANKAFYRVVAVDGQGRAERPFRLRRGAAAGDFQPPDGDGPGRRRVSLPGAGQPRSLGDLSARMKDGQQVNGYFDVEQPRFALSHGPAWLKIDAATGLLSGVPDAPGKPEVTLTAAIDRQVRKLDEAALRWGNEKVLSVGNEQIGAATQTFVIDVR